MTIKMNAFIHNMAAHGAQVLTAFLCLIVFVFLLWLILRGVRLWYWKVNVQVDALKNIDQKLQEIKQELQDGSGCAQENFLPEAAAAKAETSQNIQSPTEGSRYSTGKTGQIYTEEELEVLIKD